MQFVEDEKKFSCVVIEGTVQRFLLRTIAADSYSGHSRRRFDVVKVKVNKEQTSSRTNDKKTLIWFARVLAFVQMN